MKNGYLFGSPYVVFKMKENEIRIFVDTGFDGALVLPKSVIHHCKFPFFCETEYTLANGAIVQAEIFQAPIKWLNKRKIVLVVAGNDDTCLLGMELLKDAKTLLIPSQNVLSIEAV